MSVKYQQKKHLLNGSTQVGVGEVRLKNGYMEELMEPSVNLTVRDVYGVTWEELKQHPILVGLDFSAFRMTRPGDTVVAPPSMPHLKYITHLESITPNCTPQLRVIVRGKIQPVFEVRPTGEVRKVRYMEYYLDLAKGLNQWDSVNLSLNEYPIYRVTRKES